MTGTEHDDDGPGLPGPLADRLLAHCAAEFGCPQLSYASPPTRLTGGFDTAIFSFRLSGAPDALAGPLVLRLHPATQSADKARFEGTAQDALVAAGVPAPPVHLIGDDVDLLGGAFLVMDHLPGRRLVDAPDDISSALLGRAHAQLHHAPTGPLRASLVAAGLPSPGVGRLLGWLDRVADRHPRIRSSVDWLQENRPAEPATLSVCHGDFHKLNVLVDGDRVTGILDWSALTIADPVFDVATTIMIFTITARHLVADGTFSPTDLDQVVADYLAAYGANRPLPRENLDYYLALRCLRSLGLGLEGQKLRLHRAIVDDLARTIERITGHPLLP